MVSITHDVDSGGHCEIMSTDGLVRFVSDRPLDSIALLIARMRRRRSSRRSRAVVAYAAAVPLISDFTFCGTSRSLPKASFTPDPPASWYSASSLTFQMS